MNGIQGNQEYGVNHPANDAGKKITFVVVLSEWPCEWLCDV